MSHGSLWGGAGEVGWRSERTKMTAAGLMVISNNTGYLVPLVVTKALVTGYQADRLGPGQAEAPLGGQITDMCSERE